MHLDPQVMNLCFYRINKDYQKTRNEIVFFVRPEYCAFVTNESFA